MIASGETITIPTGRIAVLPNLQVDGTLDIQAGAEVFVPSGSTFTAEYITLQSPDTTIWKVSVSDAGTIVITEVI